MKPITKEHNKFDILTYYVLALISVSIGIAYNAPIMYLVTVVLILLALFRKYWLHKRLN